MPSCSVCECSRYLTKLKIRSLSRRPLRHSRDRDYRARPHGRSPNTGRTELRLGLPRAPTSSAFWGFPIRLADIAAVTPLRLFSKPPAAIVKNQQERAVTLNNWSDLRAATDSDQHPLRSPTSCFYPQAKRPRELGPQKEPVASLGQENVTVPFGRQASSLSLSTFRNTRHARIFYICYHLTP